MGKSKEVRLLTKLLDEMPHLKQLNHDNSEYELWRDKVLVTLVTLYGRNSREYNRFAMRIRSYNPYDSEDEEQQKYLRYVSTDENSLKSVIAIVERRHEINSILRVQRAIKWMKSRIIEFWQSIKSHRIRSIIFTVLIIGITLLGTNWTTVQENIIKFLDFFR